MKKMQCICTVCWSSLKVTEVKRIRLQFIYNYINQINAHALICQSAMVYCASIPMEKSRLF